MASVLQPKALLWFFIVNTLVALAVSFSFWTTEEGIYSFFIEYFIFSFTMSACLGLGVGLIVCYADRRLPWIEKPVARLFFDLITVTTFSFVVSFLLSAFFAFFVWDIYQPGREFWIAMLRSTILPIIIALAITLILTSRSFLLEWRRTAIEAEKMKSERYAGQYQSLKDQLNPHFLFNSLNVLGNLIYEAPDRANIFIEKLAAVYRYVLDVQNEELVTLADELEFAHTYLDLHEIRFGNKFKYQIETYGEDEVRIPPLTLQLLIENVIKHNRATTSEPLDISISRKDMKLEVTNKLQPRISDGPDSGIGLKNIRERYRFFTDAEVAISNGSGSFLVSIPLISNSEKR